MTKREAQAFVKRYQRVNAYEQREAKQTPIVTRARQLNAMIGFAKALHGKTATPRSTTLIRKRWNLLRKAHHERTRL